MLHLERLRHSPVWPHPQPRAGSRGTCGGGSLREAASPSCPPAPASQTRLRASASLPHAPCAGQLGDDWPRSCSCVSPRGPPPCLVNPDLVPSSPALRGRGLGLAPGGQPLPPSKGVGITVWLPSLMGPLGPCPGREGPQLPVCFPGCTSGCVIACVHLCIRVCVMCVPACLCGFVYVHRWVSLYVDTCLLCVRISACVSLCVLTRECTHTYSHRPAE